MQEGFLNTKYDGISFRYIRLAENMGGAGGFYEGMKRAYEKSGNLCCENIEGINIS